ncbi:MAG: phosphoribosyltransferase, partial [Lachnospiraceae bacterium]|nr:phosphoribosyltransferase [Lachnospiraceae bacterium]
MQQDEIRSRMVKFYARGDRHVTINATQGHFATSQSHINYYIDVTRLKVRVAEAQEAARSLRQKLLHNVETVDTIVCLDGTEVLGAFLAQELEKGDFRMTNKHETMYVVEPEENSIHQFMFRENIRPSIEGKNILLLVATMTTGETVKKSLECIEYYGGIIQGVAAIFSTTTEIEGTKVYPLFDQEDLPGYATYAPHD